ncbi:MAG: phosphate ABC transporter permease subunit PstC [Planctomycetota bacterium]|nr:phosphate ABC transporter permease subunit PstC [Planctomycetota bacterium]
MAIDDEVCMTDWVTESVEMAATPAKNRRVWRSIVKSRRWTVGVDALLGLAVRGCAAVLVLMLVGLLWVLAAGAMPSVKAFGWSFVTGQDWRPNELEVPKRDAAGKVVMEDGEVVVETLEARFGALPVIYGTLVSSVIALGVALPLSLGAALFLVRVGPSLRVAGVVSFLVEFLAAIPSIAYGIWGLFVLVPFLRGGVEEPIRQVLSHVPWLDWLFLAGGRPLAMTGRDMLCGGLLLGVMIVPIITAVARDVLAAVPRAQIEGTLALGATWWQSSREMLRYGRSALFGAAMLGLARAAGETMAVTMVIGNSNQIVASVFAPAQTMSSLLANEFAEASSPIHRSALTEVALILLVLSLVFNVIARYFVVGTEARTAAAH